MEHYLKITEMVVAESGDSIKTVLGSCIGLCLIDQRGQRAGMVHVMMPSGGGPDEPEGKYADRAVSALIALLEAAGSPRKYLIAKIAGGASMFGRKTDLKDDPLAIGDRNRQVVMERLKEFKIPLEADQTGGSTGRNITLDCATGEVVVRCQDGTGCTI